MAEWDIRFIVGPVALLTVILCGYIISLSLSTSHHKCMEAKLLKHQATRRLEIKRQTTTLRLYCAMA